MAYRRRRTYRSRGKRRARLGRRRTKTKQIATKSFVRKELRKNVEVKKEYFTAVTAVGAGTMTTFDMLIGVVPGTGSNGRIGREITAIGTKFACVLTNASTLYPAFFRLMCVSQKDEDSSTTEMFEQGPGSAPISYGTGADLSRVIKKLNRTKFRVYYDKTFKVAMRSADNSNENWVRVIKTPLLKMKQKIVYDTAASGGAATIHPRLRWMWFVEHSAVTVNTLGINKIVQTYFTDE